MREIVKNGDKRRLRNATVKDCAKALGLEVHELRTLPLEVLLPRMCSNDAPKEDISLQGLRESASQPELVSWIERNPDRAAQLTSEEVRELLNIQGQEGPLGRLGVDQYITLLDASANFWTRWPRSPVPSTCRCSSRWWG